MRVGWDELLSLLVSVGYGVVSAIVPVVNAELFVVASQVSAVAGSIPVAVGVGIGQTIGKLLLFLGVRHGRDLPFVRHRRERARSRAKSSLRLKFDAFVSLLLHLVGRKRWGLPITFAAAVVGMPPLYAVALLAGATSMRALWFTLVVLAGRVIRFVLVALGVTGLVLWF